MIGYPMGRSDSSKPAPCARWTTTATLRRKPRQPEGPSQRPIWIPSCTSSVRLDYIPRDDKGKVGCTGKLPSHMYKTLTPAAGKRGLSLSLDLTLFFPKPQTLLSREGHSGFLPTWASEGPLWVTPPISKEAFCVRSPSPRRPKGQADRALRRGSPREHQSTQEVSTPTDVCELAHSNENRSSRHLSSTPDSFVTVIIGRELIPHRRWRTCTLGREQVESTPRLDS
ncbi:hypothetical protein B296_00053515 [Ensete ventricosum]|uniref:Uncharacterized protein n=1 Tax=Ensete ventricosum TaxID=4639 RepID=A0A426X6P9_ENSVE|nr:hypothetical protein B296_00053515 [Ensete ventricosum]